MSIKLKSIKAVTWSFIQMIGTGGFKFLVGIYLARELNPNDFGLVGMILIILELGYAIVHGGLKASLIHTKDCKEEDYSTIFYSILIESLILYCLCWMISSYIAAFYQQSELSNILKVYCLSFFFVGISVVPKAIFEKELAFKMLTKINLPGVVFGGLVGVVAASLGYGVWSLIYMELSMQIVIALFFLIHNPWRPKLVFNTQRLHYHFLYGYKLLLAQIIKSIGNNIYYIIIGKIFPASVLGYYSRADSTKQFPINIFSNALDSVTFPVFIELKYQPKRLKKAYKKLLQQIIFCLAPILGLFIILAVPLFEFLFTSKWLPAVPYFQLLCIIGLYIPLNYNNTHILKVFGRTDLVLNLELFKQVLIIINILLTAQYGILNLLIGQLFVVNIVFFLSTYFSVKYINYSGLEQIRDLSPIIAISIFAMFLTGCLDRYYLQTCTPIIRLIVGSLSGSSLYLFFAFVIKLPALESFFDLIRQFTTSFRLPGLITNRL